MKKKKKNRTQSSKHPKPCTTRTRRRTPASPPPTYAAGTLPHNIAIRRRRTPSPQQPRPITDPLIPSPGVFIALLLAATRTAALAAVVWRGTALPVRDALGVAHVDVRQRYIRWTPLRARRGR